MASPETMYGQNADLAAERDAILALPPDQMQRALMAFSQRRSGVPEIPGGYRNAEFAADLPAPTGRFAANIVPGAGAADAKSLMGKDETPPAATGSSSTTSPQTAQLSPALQSIFGRMSGRIEEDVGLTRQQGEIQQRQAGERATGARDAQRGLATAERAAAEEFRSRPIPAFIPTQETAADMGTLFSLLAVAGQALGGKGKTGAMAAMSAMTGMMNGYRQGRQDLYQKERQNFDAGLRQIQAQNQALQEMYTRATRAAQTDMQGALAEAERRAIELGAPLAALAARRAGNQGLNTIDQSYAQVVNQLESRVQAARQAAAVREQTRADAIEGEQRRAAAARQTQIEQEQRARAEADRVRGITTQAEAQRNERELAEQRDRDYRNVEGQARFLEQQGLPREVVRRNLGPPEVQRVAARLQAAENTYSLAQAIRNNPQAAGLAGQLISRLDRLDLSRYGSEGDPSALGRVLNLFVEQQPLQGTPDQVAQARSIAKLAVDVINARALSASGGNRMLVSELNIMKSQIGIDSLSPLSSVTTYNNMADKDLEELAALGLSEYVPQLRNRVRAHSDAYVARVYPPVGGGGNTTTSNASQPRPPIGNVRGAQGEANRARASEPVTITDDDAGRAALRDLPPGTDVILPNGVRTQTRARPTPQ
jgi:hypothetical protein